MMGTSKEAWIGGVLRHCESEVGIETAIVHPRWEYRRNRDIVHVDELMW